MEVKLFVLCIFVLHGVQGLVIPEELSSLLSVAFSNIPPIKKGTDSRVGFGFAFGNHADFQVMLELGPQTNTATIGQAFASNSKRHVSSTPGPNKNKNKFLESNGSYLQNWAQKMNNPEDFKLIPDHEIGHLKEQIPGEVPNLEESLVDLQKNENGEYEIRQPPPSHIPPQVLYQLKKLYGQNQEKVDDGITEREQQPKKTDLRDNYDQLSVYNVRQRTQAEVKKITADLSDVDLD